ncbi:glycosyltransferase [Methanogenium marinum]|uniref:Glycosyltransferase n=1 Tax=Methanogenium marinum TaxID=348610 RepID=A0A9Q4KTS8_9EURY|nr:glycosyltransferase [Methanogenium marinum]MDE4908656.1 glycosyltransferase [Methanogenium marinum]
MNILLVSTQDYIHHPIPSRHHYIFERLAERHTVHVPHFHVSRGPERTTSLHVHEATLFPLKSPFLHYTLNAPYHFVFFNKFFRENDIDVVVAAHVLAGTAVILAAKRHKIPVLFDLKDWFPDSAAAYYSNSGVQSVVRNAVFRITRWNLKNSDRISTVSPVLVKKLANFGFEADLITNGVDLSCFAPMKIDRKGVDARIKPESFVIGFSGSVERWYDLIGIIDTMPEIIKYYPETIFLIVGPGLFTAYYHELVEKVKEYGIEDRVFFAGKKEYSELPLYINAMDLCMIPLEPKQWIDIALPNKFFEYSACGKHILSTEIPGIMDYGYQNVEYYRSKDELTDSIKRCIDEYQEGTYHSDVPEQINENDWNQKAEEMENVLFSLIKMH